jgi:hypothetical protein
LTHGVLHLLRVGHIADEHLRTSTRLANLAGRFVGRRRISIQKCHLGTLLRQGDGDGPAQASACTGHDRAAAIQAQHRGERVRGQAVH